MRAVPLFLLACLLATPGFADEADDVVSSPADKLNFEIRTPPDSIDWEIEKVDEANAKRGVLAHLKTFWADSDPPSECSVYLSVTKLSREFSKLSNESIKNKWVETLAGHVENKRNLKEGPTKLAGQEAYSYDVTGNNKVTGGITRFQWIFARNGVYLYSIYAYRSYDAVEDEDLDAEVQQIYDNFKFYEIKKIKAHKKGGAKGGDPGAVDAGNQGGTSDAEMDPTKIERAAMKLAFWKLKCVKPQGLVSVPSEKFDASEQANGLIVKFERMKDQSRCMIRVYARSLKSGQRVYTIQQLADRIVKSFEKTYKKTMRQTPKYDKKWKIKGMSKKSLGMKILGRRTTTEITWWYFADCKNDRQYQIQIYVTGGTGETVWKTQIDDFLKNFKPIK